MIEFTCTNCSRAFAVPDNFAGRRARCKTCGVELTVPAAKVSIRPASPTAAPQLPPAARPQAGAPSVSSMPPQVSTLKSAPPAQVPPVQSPPAEASPKVPMRIRRLLADAQQMATAFEKSELIKVTPGPSSRGNPPDSYKIEYSIKSLERDAKGKPAPRDKHLVEIQLTSDYPRLSPQCKMISPIFHPNIDTTTICVGDHWTAGERLVDLAIRIGEMLAYQAYNIKSPLDGEAAMWADLNPTQLPTDPRSIRPAGIE